MTSVEVKVRSQIPLSDFSFRFFLSLHFVLSPFWHISWFGSRALSVSVFHHKAAASREGADKFRNSLGWKTPTTVFLARRTECCVCVSPILFLCVCSSRSVSVRLLLSFCFCVFASLVLFLRVCVSPPRSYRASLTGSEPQNKPVSQAVGSWTAARCDFFSGFIVVWDSWQNAYRASEVDEWAKPVIQ